MVVNIEPPIPDEHPDETSETSEIPTTPEDEAQIIWNEVASLPKDVLERVPSKLRANRHALFLLTLFRANGYLDREFWPLISKAKGETHKTNCAFLINGIACALNIDRGKWQLFEKFWNMDNLKQLYNKVKKPGLMRFASDFEIGVVDVLRQAVALNPVLNTEALENFIGDCPTPKSSTERA